MRNAKNTIRAAVIFFLSLVLMAAASMSVFAGDVRSAEAPAGSIELQDEFAAWGLNSDPADVTLYDGETPENAVSEYKGMSYDKEKATLYLNNNHSDINAWRLQVSDMGALTIDVTGNCEFFALSAGDTDLTITGSGTLTLNRSYNLVGKPGFEEDTKDNREFYLNWGNNIFVENGTLLIDKDVTINCNGERCFYISSNKEGSVSVDDVFTCRGKPSQELKWTVTEPEKDGHYIDVRDSTYHIYHKFPAGKIYALEGYEGDSNYWIISNVDYSTWYYMTPLVEKNSGWYEDFGGGYVCQNGVWHKIITEDEETALYSIDNTPVEGSMNFVPYTDYSGMDSTLVSDGYAEANVCMAYTGGGSVYTKGGKRYIMVVTGTMAEDQHYWINKRLDPVDPTVPEGEKDIAIAMMEVHTEGTESWLTFDKEVLTAQYDNGSYAVDQNVYDWYGFQQAGKDKAAALGYEASREWVDTSRGWSFELQNSDITITPGKTITPSVKLDKTSYVYDGSVKHPAVTVYDGNTKLADTDYTVTYPAGCKDVGNYDVTVTLKGKYSGTGSASFSITKAAQSMKVTAGKKTVKYKKVKKKAQTVSGAIKLSGAKGTVTYTKVSKGSDKKLTINKTTGKITVKKGTKKGKHKIVVKVKASGGKNYKSAAKKVTVTITVK